MRFDAGQAVTYGPQGGRGLHGCFVSAASIWEIATKYRIGKWPEASTVVGDFETHMVRHEFTDLPILRSHALLAGSLVSDHRDPFDRLLAARAMIDGLTLVSADAKLAGLGAVMLW